MDRSERLSLAYVMEAQTQKHVTVNETFRALDALLHLTVQSRQVMAEPASPAAAEAYILPAGKTGTAWSGFTDDAVAVWQDGAWTEYQGVVGLTAYIVDEGRHLVWNGAAWSAFDSEEAARIGINTLPDSTNKLSVKSDAVLMSHDDVTPGTGDLRLKINKATLADTASIILQSAFSGRVEFGLTGTNDFTLRVSADGINFLDAIIVDHITGEVSFPNTSDLGGTPPPLWVPSGANFAISAAEEKIWTDTGGEVSNLLSTAGASFSVGTNPLVISQAGGVSVGLSGTPRRSHDAAQNAWGYVTQADLPLLDNGAPVPPQLLGMDLTFDYEVDPVNGDDGHAGTPAAPFATLGALISAINGLSAPVTVNALIRAGDYVNDPIGGTWTNKTLTLVFEPGATLRSTETGIASVQGIDITAGRLTVYGNGLHVRDWQGLEEVATNDYLSSSNGLAAHGTGELIVHDVKVSNCGDGLTMHSSAQLEAYRCWAEDCDKYAVVHVNTSTSYHEDCVFIGGNGHGGTDVRPPSGIAGAFEGASGDHEFVRCRFLPSPNGSVTKIDGNETAIFRQCQLGSYEDTILLRNAEVVDSFVNFYAEMNEFTKPLTRCFGKATIRLREAGTSTPVLTNCVFVGPASGQPNHFLYTNYNPGSFGQITLQDCILMGYNQAIAIERAESPGYWQASGSSIESCTFYNNSANFGTQASAEVGTTITNSIFTDPALGAYADTELMAQYAAGSGTDGFNAGQALTVGPPDASNDQWNYGNLAALGLENGDTVRLTAIDDTISDIVLSGGMLTIPPGHWKLIYGPV